MDLTLITYEEYCALTNTKKEATIPGWFENTQMRAVRIIVNDISQSHVFPIDRDEFLTLKPYFKNNVGRGISEQIKFIYENPRIFDNSFAGNISQSVGELALGPLNSGDVHYLLNHMCPNAKEYFQEIGWTWMSLDKKLKKEIFYGEYHPAAEWGYIFGDINAQSDLIALINSGKAEWGKILGNIENQADLMDLIAKQKTEWGKILGNIEDQTDLVEYINSHPAKINIDGTTIVKNAEDVIGVGEIPQSKVTGLTEEIKTLEENTVKLNGGEQDTKEPNQLFLTYSNAANYSNSKLIITDKQFIIKHTQGSLYPSSEVNLRDGDITISHTERFDLDFNKIIVGSKIEAYRKSDYEMNDNSIVINKDLESYVKTSGDQTISGTKTFTNHIKVPNGVSVDDAVNFGQIAEFIKSSSLDAKAFTQIGGLISLKLRPSGNLVLQSDGLGVDMTKVAYSQSGVTQIISSNWNYDGQMDFRVKLPLANDRITGQPLTPTLPGQLVNKNYTDENFSKKDLSNVSDFAMSKAMVNTLKRSLNFNSGELNYQSDADGGNIFIKMGQRKPVRSGTINVSNKFNGTSTQKIGNRWYANWNEVPELNNSLYEVVLFTSIMPSYVVANNQDQNGYAVRFDNPAYSNTDSTITLRIGENLTKIEGKLDSPITGYYMRTSNTYQLVQFNMYFELSADKTHLDIYGQCSGRDRQIYLNLPGDEGPTNFAPQTYQMSYAIYERERRVN